MQTDVAVAHFAFNFRTGDQSRDTIDHDNIHRARADQRFGNFQRLFTGIRLADIEIVDINANLGCIDWIKRMFDINKATDAPLALCFGDHMETDSGFTRTFWAIDFDDTAARHTTNAQGNIHAQAAGWDRFDRELGRLAQLHYHTIAIFFIQAGQRGL